MTTPSQPTAAEFIARQFHSVYEALAPYEGYRTRDESAVPWDDVPEVNRRLMVRTVETLIHADVIRQGNNHASAVPDRLPDNDESRGHGSVR